MKAILFTFLALIFCQAVIAQIIVTTTDMPVAAQSYTLSTASASTTIDTSMGADKTWDYSTLSAITQNEDTFYSKSSMPPAYQLFFLTSNLGEKAPDISFGNVVSLTNSYNIYKNSVSVFEQTAAAGELNGAPIPIYYSPADKWYLFPLHFGDTSTSNSSYSVSLPTIGSFSQQRVRKNKVVGWGSLKLHMGNYNVLMVKSILLDHDSLYVDFLGSGAASDFTSYQYKFIGQNHGLPLLEIDVSVALGRQQVTSVTYQDTLAIVSGISVNEQHAAFSSFPNPSANVLRVITNYGKDLKMIDVMGRNIFTQSLNNVSTDIDVSGFPNGLYFITISDYSKNTVTKKIVIQH